MREKGERWSLVVVAGDEGRLLGPGDGDPGIVVSKSGLHATNIWVPPMRGGSGRTQHRRVRTSKWTKPGGSLLVPQVCSARQYRGLSPRGSGHQMTGVGVPNTSE